MSTEIFWKTFLSYEMRGIKKMKSIKLSFGVPKLQQKNNTEIEKNNPYFLSRSIRPFSSRVQNKDMRKNQSELIENERKPCKNNDPWSNSLYSLHFNIAWLSKMKFATRFQILLIEQSYSIRFMINHFAFATEYYNFAV